MKRSLVTLAATGLVLFAWLAATPGGARAQLQPQLTVEDPCKTAAAATTVTWVPSSPIARATGGPRYGTRGCSRFIADFQVGQLIPLGGHSTQYWVNANVHWTNELLSLPEAECQTLIVDAIIYRREADGAMTRIGGGRHRGRIQNSTCTLAPEASWVAPPAQMPPATGTTLIRVAESAKLGNRWLPVDIVLHRAY